MSMSFNATWSSTTGALKPRNSEGTGACVTPVKTQVCVASVSTSVWLAVVASVRRRARPVLRIGEEISLPHQRTSFAASELERVQFYSLELGQNFLALIPGGVRVSTLDEAQRYSARLPEQANLGPRELEGKLRERFPGVPIDHLGQVRAED